MTTPASSSASPAPSPPLRTAERGSRSRSPAEARRCSGCRRLCSSLTDLLADHTTLRLGGPAAAYVCCEDTERLVATVAEADERGTPVLLLGGGSNLVVS